MIAAEFLADTSALFRLFEPQHRAAWAPTVGAGLVAVCPAVELEFLYSARSSADRAAKDTLLRSAFGWLPMADGAFARAAEVQELLTARGLHRSAGTVDLLIAATAERAGVVVLTDDRDFTAIAQVTGQPVRFVADHPE